jgi:hypothetical protein
MNSDDLLVARVRRTQLLQGLRGIQAARRQLEITQSATDDVAAVVIGGLSGSAAAAVILAQFTGVWTASGLELASPKAWWLAAFVVVSIAVVIVGVRLTLRRNRARRLAAKGDLTAIINDLKAKYPQLIASCGGADALHDKEVVCALVHELTAKGTSTPRTQPHRGQLVFTLGILGWFIPVVSIIAWIMGHADLEAMKAGTMDRGGQSATYSGKMLGMLATLLHAGVLALILWRDSLH